MKKENVHHEPVSVQAEPKVTINERLDEVYERDRNSPFIKRKIAQAEAFLDKHGLPEGWGEWKNKENMK